MTERASTEPIDTAAGNRPLEAARYLVATVAGRDMDTIGIGDRLIDDFLMDSLEFLEMAMMIEDIWGTALNASELMQLVTVADVARVLPADARVPKVSPPAVS